MKNIFLAGSTGSIGQNAISVARLHPDYLNITAIAAGHYSLELIRQVIDLKPLYCVVGPAEDSVRIKAELSTFKNINTEVLCGEAGLKEVASSDKVNVVLNAVSGSSGLMLSYWALLFSKELALANKESLVMAGEVLSRMAIHSSCRIVPIDSEHSAIFQCLNCGVKKDVKRLILTASGGPFFRMNLKDMDKITKEMALSHPRWKMGKKISIDSSTLANKGLEIIEAHYLFGIGEKNIEVLIHPEAVIHSMVEYVDGSIIAQLAVTDMKGPIGYALSYPERFENLMETIDLAKVGKIEFFKPDFKKFPFIGLARDALRINKSMPCVFSTANEFFVEKFLEGKVNFTGIAVNVEKVMCAHLPFELNAIEDVLGAKKIALELSAKVL